MIGNVLAWRIWSLANASDRQITQFGLGPISTMPILSLCELYDATVDDFEKVLTLEGLLYKGFGNKESDGEKPNLEPEKAIRAIKAKRRKK